MKQNLLDFDSDGLISWFAQIGEKPFRANQLLRWIHQLGETDLDRMSDLSKHLRGELAKRSKVVEPEILSDTLSRDGTRKWLLQAGSGNAIETVFIPEERRGTLCISTQVGCAMDCAFCATGKQGLSRNLKTGEIVGQLWSARKVLGDFRSKSVKSSHSHLAHTAPSGSAHSTVLPLTCRSDRILDHADESESESENGRIISNVVLMGMGEPLANFDNVVTALRVMLDDNAYGLSRRRVTVSTSGIVPAMDRLREQCPVALAVSLHAPNDELRDKLIPINRKFPLSKLMAACRRYLESSPRDHITFEYVMLDGINDTDSHAHELIRLIGDLPCKFNLIPFNPFNLSNFQRSPSDRIRRFAEILMRARIVTTIRKTRGEDIDAACGQLAGKVTGKTRRKDRQILQAVETAP